MGTRPESHCGNRRRLKELSGLTNLAALDLHLTDVTDAGLAHIANRHGIRVLYLSYTRVTGAGLTHLVELNRLESLDLFGTGVSDEAATHIAKLTNLRRLELGFTALTGVGLSRLATLKELRSLSLVGTQVTKANVLELQALLPRCRIEPPQFGEPDPGSVNPCECPFCRGGSAWNQAIPFASARFRLRECVVAVAPRVRRGPELSRKVPERSRWFAR